MTRVPINTMKSPRGKERVGRGQVSVINTSLQWSSELPGKEYPRVYRAKGIFSCAIEETKDVDS